MFELVLIRPVSTVSAISSPMLYAVTPQIVYFHVSADCVSSAFAVNVPVVAFETLARSRPINVPAALYKRVPACKVTAELNVTVVLSVEDVRFAVPVDRVLL